MTCRGIGVVRVVASVLLVGWAAFWLWFSGAVLVSEWDGSVAWEPVFKIVLPIVGLTALGLAAPRAGGLLLIAASIVAAWQFDNTAARLLFALPMLAAGVALTVTGPWVRSIPTRRTHPTH